MCKLFILDRNTLYNDCVQTNDYRQIKKNQYNIENINIKFIADFCPHLGSFCCFSHYVSAKFHIWTSSGD